MKIGIDVGGTHTDAVVLSGSEILATHKALTSSDVKEGIVNALDAVMFRRGTKLIAFSTIKKWTSRGSGESLKREYF